ncbi:DUF2863 family protein [Massilia arenosa]|uniref:DUF2863 family protein n=1 Tax=Zemynaea arenosa TaxID=2561931 RepID=A0A4Y9SGJ4_9BURK|nr:DUF2863 family protein [Massilia arenosa]TFW19344.1 DUF2863 family protein [Massilia arenosa]
MRRPSKDSSLKLSAEGQRLISLAQAIVQVGSRVEERSLEQQLDQTLQRLLKSNHQDTIDNALNVLFKDDLLAYDTLTEAVEAVSESSYMVELEDGTEQRYTALLIAAPVLAWTRFTIPQGPIPADLLSTLSAHFGAHLLADGVRLAMAPHLFSIDQLPRSHGELYSLTHKLAQAAYKNLPVKLQLKAPDTVPFLADTRYLLVAVVVPHGGPIFRWQEPAHQNNFQAERQAALEQWRTQATPNVSRLLPGCGIELLLPEAYYVGCREADKLIRPVSIRAAVHYLTNTLGCEPGELRAVIAGFGEESSEAQVDEYRVAFTMRQSTDVVYGIVWPLYGQEDEDGTPVEGLMNVAEPAQRTPLDEIVACLNEIGITHIKRHSERFVAEYCDDCGAPLFADPTGELVHAEMPEDAPVGTEHFH